MKRCGMRFKPPWPPTRTGERREGTRQPSLLTGLVVDEQGEGLSPSHAVKKGRRYRYYVSRHLILEGKRAGRKGWRLPAADLEGLVTVRPQGLAR